MRGKAAKMVRRGLAFALMLSMILADIGIVKAYESSEVEAYAVKASELLFEKKYRVSSENKTLFQNVALLRYGVEASDVMDDVPVALYLEDGQYLALSISARKGDLVFRNTDLATDGSEQFVLRKAGDWSLDHLAYYIFHPQSGLYIDLDGQDRLYASGKEKPAHTFLFEKTGYTDVGLLTTLPGYEQLSEADQKRVLDVFGGVGAKSLFRWGGSDPNNSVANQLASDVKNIYANAQNGTTTAEQQAEAMREKMALPVYSGQTGWYDLPQIPGIDGIKTVQSEGVEGTYDFWRGTMLEGKKYTFSIIDDYGTHTMDVYVQNDPVAQTNGNNLLEAIKQIPYPVRRNIQTIKVRWDEANSYNCGTHDLYMRLTWSPSVNSVAQYIMHEFGHSMDFSYNVNGSGEWQKAIDADILKVSDYGATNGYEDFAEFSRLYFQMYGNYNGMYALRQLYPNRFRIYAGVLEAAQYEDLYEKRLYLPDVPEPERYTGVLAKFTFDDVESGLRSGTAIAEATGQIVLDENGRSGRALYLDGTGSNYLKVSKKDYTSLLEGYDAFTISYYSKPEKNEKNWPVFLAPDEKTQVYEEERYIGIVDGKNGITVEQYNCYGRRNESIYTEQVDPEAWRLVTVVVKNDETILYVDGERKGSISGTADARDILGKHSIFQIGKGNWDEGEYYSGLIDEMTVYGRALTENEVKNIEDKEMVAQFNFDNETDGFRGKGGLASKNGTYELREDAVSGKSLYLNGNGFLDISSENGTPLLADTDELTVSYYSKAEKEGGQWTFFLAPDRQKQEVGFEKYVGILDNVSNVDVERYYNNGSRPASIHAGCSNDGEWKHVIAVLENGMTTLYIDGVRVSYVRSTYPLSRILGQNSILQVGKGNWGDNGEFYQGYIDELTIWDHALSKAEVYDALGSTAGPSQSKRSPVYRFDFENNLQEEKGIISASAKTEKLAGDYDGTVTYEKGMDGNAVKLGDHGLKLNTSSVGEQYTVTFWTKINQAVAEFSPLMFVGVGANGGSEDWISFCGSGNDSLMLWSKNNIGASDFVRIEQEISYETDQWQQYILSVDRGRVTLYRNGVPEITGVLSASAYNRMASDVYFGVNAWDAVADMWVDKAAVYNTAFTAEEAAEKYKEEKETEEPVVDDPVTLPFVDVAEDDWFYDGVYYNYVNHIVEGKDKTHFAPYENLARAQFAVILHRIAGKPAAKGNVGFPDVQSGQWYTDAVLWAAGEEVGIIKGYSDSGLFGTADHITREQMAVMMYRYAEYKGYRLDADGTFDGFTDGDKVSGFAEKAMKWAVGNGIITGKDNGTRLDPQGSTSRAECAVIIQRFTEKYGS